MIEIDIPKNEPLELADSSSTVSGRIMINQMGKQPRVSSITPEGENEIPVRKLTEASQARVQALLDEELSRAHDAVVVQEPDNPDVPDGWG